MRSGIALGSNVGDRLANLREGFRALRTLHRADSGDLLVSSVYRTAPVGCEQDANEFLNAVAEIETDLAPVDLWKRLREVERGLGRPSERPRNAPRTIDLDVLYVGPTVLESPELTVPHPRLSQRRFVLAPLAEIAPELVVPGQNRSVRALLDSLPDAGAVTRIAEVLRED